MASKDYLEGDYQGLHKQRSKYIADYFRPEVIW